MKRVYRGKDILSIKGRHIFFDTNILMYVHFSTPSMGQWPTIYTQIYKNLISGGNPLLLDYNVLSEVINRELRINHQIHKTSTKNNISYKTWRNSSKGSSVEARTYSIIKKNILAHFQVDGKIYNLGDIHGMLIPSNQDFTDRAIINLCKEKNYILFTNDSDFLGEDLEILSENPRLV